MRIMCVCVDEFSYIYSGGQLIRNEKYVGNKQKKTTFKIDIDNKFGMVSKIYHKTFKWPNEHI